MTRDEILAMEPGEKLNVLVGKAINASPEIEWHAMDREEKGYYITFCSSSDAEDWHNRTVTKFPKHPYSADGGHIVRKERYRTYSNDIASAFAAVEKLKSEGISVAIWSRRAKHPWYVQIGKSYEMPIVEAATLPEAICKAALLVVLGRG